MCKHGALFPVSRIKFLFLTGILLAIWGCDANLLTQSPPRDASLTQAAKVALPVISPLAGTFASDQTVEITCPTAGAKTHYTIDGSTPTALSTEYSAPIQIAGNGTEIILKVIGVKEGMADSEVAVSRFSIAYPLIALPVFSPASGSYGSDQSISISCATPGTTIYYTMTSDGSSPPAPTSSSTKYTAVISAAGDGSTHRIKAIAVAPGMVDSNVAESTYTINYSLISTPTFSLADGDYTFDQTVSISCATPGVTIYYTITTNGSLPATPTTSSTMYTTPIPVAGNGAIVKISAIAVAPGLTDSNMASASFTITYPGSITVSLNPPSATPIVFSGNSTTLLKGASMTVSTTFIATSYAWYLDNSSIPASTNSSYTIATTSLGFGMHSLVLIVVSGGVSYSGSFNFQVTQ